MKIILVKRITALVIFCLISFSVKAKDPGDQSSKPENIFNFDIYSLSKKKESAFDASSATYIITAEDIRRSGVTSVPEALRLAPGVQVARIDGDKWAITIRGFDRQFSNKLLVMIDGRTVYTPLFSGVFWELIDYVIEDIEKIEVVRGPGGTIWGANAVNGIINIITKNAAQTQGSYVSQVIGNEDRSITEVRYGGKTIKNNHYRIYAKKLIRDGANKYSDGKSNDDGTMQDKAGFRYDITSVKDSIISIHGDISSGKSKNFFAFDDDMQTKDSNKANLMVSLDKTLSKKSSITLQSYFDYDQFSAPVLKRSARTFDVDFQHFYNFSRENKFIWGLGYRQIVDDIEQNNINGTNFIPIAYYPDKRNDEIYSAFIQEKIGLIPDKLYWTIGSKFLINDYAGFEYQPNTRLTYFPSRNQTIWTAVSRAVRTPTRGEASFDIKDYPSGISASLGSSDAESEDVLAYEAGYRIKPTNKTLFDLTGYYNKYSKLRTYEDTGNIYGTSIASNLGSGESYGFEAVGKWQVNNELRLEASYDYLKMNLGVSDASTDATTSILASTDRLQLAEGQSPKNQFRLRAYYNITPKIEFDNMLYYVDELPLAKSSPSDPDGISAYYRFDTRIGYIASKNLDFSIGIKNLFDDSHSEFKEASYNVRTELVRTFYIKAVWQY